MIARALLRSQGSSLEADPKRCGIKDAWAGSGGMVCGLILVQSRKRAVVVSRQRKSEGKSVDRLIKYSPGCWARKGNVSRLGTWVTGLSDHASSVPPMIRPMCLARKTKTPRGVCRTYNYREQVRVGLDLSGR